MIQYNNYPSGYAPIRRTFQSKRDKNYAKTALDTLQTLVKENIDTKVLDVGCGPGSITLEFAQIIGDKGIVIGIDKEPSEISYAISQTDNISNCLFFTEDIYKFKAIKDQKDEFFVIPEINKGEIDLSFKDKTFDLVHAHALLDYFDNDDAVKVINQFYRVCKSEGTIIISLPIWGDLKFDFSSKGEELDAPALNKEHELVKSFHRRFKERVYSNSYAHRRQDFYMSIFTQLGLEPKLEIRNNFHCNSEKSHLLDLWLCVFINTLTLDKDAYTEPSLFDEIRAVCEWSRHAKACVIETWYEISANKKDAH